MIPTSTGCALPALRRAAFYPWLHPAAPSGRRGSCPATSNLRCIGSSPRSLTSLRMANEGGAVADTLTPAQRSKCLAAIRGKDTKPERVVRSILHRLGCRFALHRAGLPGKPDIVMPARGVVVFVHGCYWHMHRCKRGRSTPATHAAFWRIKRDRNRERDRKTLAALRCAGWRVVVVWECELKSRKIWRVIERLLAIRECNQPLQRPRGSSSKGCHPAIRTRRSHLRAAR